MSSIMKGVLITPILVPFLVTSSGYFILLNQKIEPSFYAVALKCSPVISLMLYVILSSKNYKYARSIFLGQIFCCIGDAFLVFPEFFELGVLAFTFGHIHYILAFGWTRSEFKKGLLVINVGICALAYLMPSDRIKGVLKYGVPIYVVVICIMVWRAIARVFDKNCDKNWVIIRKMNACGAILFSISDFLIATTMFHGWPDWSPGTTQFLVMLTYYLAQLSIALSVTEIPNHGQS